jgi:mycoredoxin
LVWRYPADAPTSGTLGVAYQYINVEDDPQASAWVKQQSNGKERKPTVKIGEQVLAEPSNEELEETLRQEGLVG